MLLSPAKRKKIFTLQLFLYYQYVFGLLQGVFLAFYLLIFYICLLVYRVKKIAYKEASMFRKIMILKFMME